jgi:hypothetical protein
MYVELGVGTKHVVKGSGTVPFQMESRGVLRLMDVIWVLELRRSLLSVSVIEKKGFDILFQDGQTLIKPIASSSNISVVFGVRESNLYRLKNQLMQTMASSKVAENKEQVALKVEQLSGSHPLGSSGKEQPSKFVKESWYKMAMQDAQEQEASRSMFNGNKSLKKGLNEMARIVFCSEGVANQVDCRVAMVADMIAKTEPPSGGRSTFLTKRKC